MTQTNLTTIQTQRHTRTTTRPAETAADSTRRKKKNSRYRYSTVPGTVDFSCFRNLISSLKNRPLLAKGYGMVQLLYCGTLCFAIRFKVPQVMDRPREPREDAVVSPHHVGRGVDRRTRRASVVVAGSI